MNTLTKWKVPSNWFGKPWTNHYVFLCRTRDSNALKRANFDAGLKAVKAVMSKDSAPGDEDDCATVSVVSENHWAVGWIEWIAIHESDTAALETASEIKNALKDYPVVDEELFNQYETDEANETWKNCFSPTERLAYIREHRDQFDFRDFADLIGCVRGKYFSGYLSEFLN